MSTPAPADLTLEARIINFMREVAEYSPQDAECSVRDIWRELRPVSVGDVLREIASLVDDEKLRMHPTGMFTLAPDAA